MDIITKVGDKVFFNGNEVTLDELWSAMIEKAREYKDKEEDEEEE